MRRLESAIDFALVTAMMMAACTPVEGSATPDVLPGVTHTPAVSTPTEQEQVIDPEFIKLQGKISQSEDFTLMGDGTLEMKTGEGIITVSGLKIDPATNECMYYGSSEPVVCQPDAIVIRVDKSVTITLATGETLITKDGVTWEPLEATVGIPAYLKDIPVLTEVPNSWDEIPRVQMEDVRSGAFAEALRQAYLDGRIEPFGDDVPVFTFSLIDPASSTLVKNYGFGPLYERGQYGKPHQDMWVSPYIGIDGEGQEWYILPQLLKSGDGVNILLGGGPLSDQDIGNMPALKAGWEQHIDPDMFIVPTHYANVEACSKAISPNSEKKLRYCEQYVGEYQAEVEILIKQWHGTGIFPRELEGYILFFQRVSYK